MIKFLDVFILSSLLILQDYSCVCMTYVSVSWMPSPLLSPHICLILGGTVLDYLIIIVAQVLKTNLFPSLLFLISTQAFKLTLLFSQSSSESMYLDPVFQVQASCFNT
uniref:Uncharacterized protein n=1 Tax=Opuntia streptacantha TaxID=393608 RepID=A0A7C9F6T1_OPUST